MAKILKTAYILLLVLVIICSNVGNVYAAKKDELNQQANEIDKKIDELNTEISGVKKQMSSAMNEVSELTSQISTYETEIAELERKAKSLQAEVDILQKKVDEKQEDYDQKKDLLNKRLIIMYEEGSVSYLDMLLGSENLTDFISKYYIISELAEADTELLNKIEKSKKEIEESKSKVEKNKKEIEDSKSHKKAKMNALTTMKKDKDKKVANLTSEEKNLQAELEQFEADKIEIANKIAAELAKEAANGGNTSGATNPSSAGYISPLAGKTKKNITCGFYGYAGHGGVDWACSSGTPIRAVKDGTVFVSTALRYSNGKYRSYGEYIIINHHDGTMTLYAHGLSGSRQVQKGDKVKQGQTIMKVGSTGNSTGPHLHFEVRVGSNRVNPTQYLP